MNFDGFEKKSAEEIVAWAVATHGLKLGLASSFGKEDMVLIDMAAKTSGDLVIFTLDTGRLHEETYEIMERTRSKYGLNIQTFFPETAAVEDLLAKKGFFSFRESVEDRKECCRIRKVLPLKRALNNFDAWMTGMRRDQSVTRTDIAKVAVDKDHPALIKINPIADWSDDQIDDYIETHNVPTNALHRKNFPSIGCQPCTRAIQEGEDIRAGRWWWENPEQKECGLHRS